jgi:hypothetical protein
MSSFVLSLLKSIIFLYKYESSSHFSAKFIILFSDSISLNSKISNILFQYFFRYFGKSLDKNGIFSCSLLKVHGSKSAFLYHVAFENFSKGGFDVIPSNNFCTLSA